MAIQAGPVTHLRHAPPYQSFNDQRAQGLPFSHLTLDVGCFRVELGGRPPRAPTDPYERD